MNLKINNIDVEFNTKDNKVFINSRDMAKVFDKRHSNMLSVIEREIIDEDFNELKIWLVKYVDIKGENRKSYNLDRDIFSLVAMSLTGAKARQWKRDFIKAFNTMEKIIKTQSIENALDDYLMRNILPVGYMKKSKVNGDDRVCFVTSYYRSKNGLKSEILDKKVRLAEIELEKRQIEVTLFNYELLLGEKNV